MQKSVTRKNHYVPEWYQKRFLLSRGGKLCYLNLYPDKKILPNGKEIVLNSYHWWAPSQCFFEKDLYTTFFFGLINDEIEKYLFGEIDTSGFAAIRAFHEMQLPVPGNQSQTRRSFHLVPTGLRSGESLIG